MKFMTIVVQPDDAALLVGGVSSPRLGGHRATARGADQRPMIPASALRGALRIELERLLLGRGEAVCGANREADPDRACDCPVCRLFGREAGVTGTLRLEDALLDTPASDGTIAVLRPRVGVSRRSGSAVDQHLVFAETTAVLGAEDGQTRGEVFCSRVSLVPRGPGDSQALEEDRKNLHAACNALHFLGGGRAQGLGWVSCRLEEASEVPGAEAQADPRTAPVAPSAGGGEVSLRVCFEALAPLHLGLGRPLGGYLPTRGSAPGSTVRGALAYALLERSLVSGEDPRFQKLFGENGSARFGTARPKGHVPSLTRRRCRPGDHVFDDLVAEVVRRQAAVHGVALAFLGAPCPVPGCSAVKALPWDYRGASHEPAKRVHTRTALNRRTLTAMDQKLFSIEVLDPPLELLAEVGGLDAETAALLTRLDGEDLWLGGKRSQGLGRCRLKIEPAPNRSAETAASVCAALDRALAEGWRVVCTGATELPERLLDEGERPVALVLSEPWAPEEEPLDEALARGPLSGHRTLASFVALTEEGRFGAREAHRWGASESVLQGEAPPQPVAGAGSVYVYAVDRASFDHQLASWVRRGRHGSGLHPELGWGRFVIRGPEDDSSKRRRSRP